MKTISGVRFVTLAAFTLVLASCALFGKGEPSDYNAQDGDFTGYEKWALAAKSSTPSAELGQAHAGADATLTRFIYVKDNAKRKDSGQFPVGTVIAKHQQKADGSLVGPGVAMVKRAKGFNAAAGDWEWFMLDAKTGAFAKNDKGEAVRGAIQGCIGCHTQAAGKDYAFTVK